MNFFKNLLFLLIGAFLGLTPVLGYYYTHGPSCPCHALVKVTLEEGSPHSLAKMYLSKASVI